jgi:SNF2 family DNA or RNA helicase
VRIELKCKTCNKPLEVVNEVSSGKMHMSKLKCGHTIMRMLTDAELKGKAKLAEIATRLDDSKRQALNSAIDDFESFPLFINTSESINPTQIEVAETIESLEQIQRFEEADNLLESLIHGDDTPENWRNAFPYQREGVEFAEGANLRMLLGDEPGLGKTVQFILMLDRNWKQMTPCLIICPLNVTTHWERFLKKWLSPGKLNDKAHKSIYLHKGRNVPLPDDFDITIVANNLISGEYAKESIIENGYKSVCLDECHNFKNEKAERTKTVIEIAGSVPHLIAMSGTPIMNRVDEYFPILHMIKPEHWPSRTTLNNICERNDRGQCLQIRPSYRPWFFDRTKSYILRRKKKDHLTGLPKFNRIAEFLNPESLNPKAAKQFALAYNFLTDQLEDEMNKKGTPSNILGVMSRMRRLTGQAKAQAAVEYALDLLDSDEDGKEKLIIGVHHHDTADLVKHFLHKASIERNDRTLEPLMMGSGDGQYKDSIRIQFANGPQRILVASILACAEGIDGLQLICSRMLNLEREWNASKEEQFEQRIDRLGQTEPVQAIYFMMLNTIDEWLHELVELKRNVVNATFDANFEADANMMRELARKVTQNRMRIVGI